MKIFYGAILLFFFFCSITVQAVAYYLDSLTAVHTNLVIFIFAVSYFLMALTAFFAFIKVPTRLLN